MQLQVLPGKSESSGSVLEAAASGKRTESSQSGSFEVLMAQAEKSQDTGTREASGSRREPERAQRERQSPAKTSETGGEARQPRKTDAGAKQPSDTQQVSDTQAEGASKPAAAKKPAETDAAEESIVASAVASIIKKLAEALGVSEEEITQALTSLGMTVMDLVDKNSLNQFMTELYKAESPADLLNVPDIVEKFDKAGAVLNEAEIARAVTAAADMAAAREGAAFKDIQARPAGETPADETAATDKAVDGIPQTQAETRGESAEDTSAYLSSKTSPLTEISKPADTLGQQQTLDLGQEFAQRLNEVFNAVPVAEQLQAARAETQAVIRANVSAVATQDIMDQIVERIKIDVRPNISEIKITLKPEHLGDVSMKVSMENGLVTAQFVAENQRVKELIESNFNQLRDFLQQQGLDVSSLSVSVGQKQDGRSSFKGNDQGPGYGLSRISAAQEEILDELTADMGGLLYNSVEFIA
ncbi:MAG: flagellar hook-length control protein FliK [Clostridiales bacterium]|jgi:flagellar hook-length control protein FliK|nr:flagellar hook-length control protein FliK [Clostridiales bacterium]